MSNSVSYLTLDIGTIVLVGIGAIALLSFAGMATMHGMMMGASATNVA